MKKFKVRRLVKRIDEEVKFNHMKGSKGVCSIGVVPNDIRRTQFNTKENCENSLNSHLSIGVVPTDYIVYKCKACGYWHFGKACWENLNI